MRKVLVPRHSVQVRLTTIFHTWLPAFRGGVGIETVKAYKQLENLRTLTSKKKTFKFLRLWHMVAMGLNHKPEVPTGQTGRERRTRGPEGGGVPGRGRRAVDTHHEDAQTGGFLQTLQPCHPQSQVNEHIRHLLCSSSGPACPLSSCWGALSVE